MLLSKANLYDEEDQMTSYCARALTHPARLKIIRSLRKNGPMTVQQLSAEHPLSLAALSQHLEILRETQIVQFKPIYPYLLYNIDKEWYGQITESILRFLGEEE